VGEHSRSQEQHPSRPGTGRARRKCGRDLVSRCGERSGQDVTSESYFYFTRLGFVEVELRFLGKRATSVPVQYAGLEHPSCVGLEGSRLGVKSLKFKEAN